MMYLQASPLLLCISLLIHSPALDHRAERRVLRRRHILTALVSINLSVQAVQRLRRNASWAAARVAYGDHAAECGLIWREMCAGTGQRLTPFAVYRLVLSVAQMSFREQVQ